MKVGTVDNSKPFIKIFNFPFVEFKKLLLYHATYTQNVILKAENSRTKNRMVEIEELRTENERLRRLFNFKRDSGLSLIVAKVIAKDPSNWTSSLIIDKGRDNGIQPGMCVVTEAGLAGKILEAGSTTSKVMLINDSNSSVSSLIQRSREYGVTSGTITGQLRLHFLPLNSDVKTADIIITSGMGGIYPKGLVIGKVAEVDNDIEGLSKSCIVKPAVRLASLEEVLIISR
ncbi:MAG: rod shape-determining protein MreC [Candidatus Omnitrophota bacterium]|nr:rod shape-determining protein MreC [Candidatus Omnitrophota bacterium]